MKKNEKSFRIDDYASKPSLLRKGNIGGWRSVFSEELNRKFDETMLAKLKGTGLEFDFGEQA